MRLHTSLWAAIALAASLLAALRTPAFALPRPAAVSAALIEQAALSAVRTQAGANERGLSLLASPLDSRLRLPACDRPLQSFLTDGQVRPQTTVGVRCAGSVRWTIYTSVLVESIAPVLVARYTLPQGAELTGADFDRVTRRLPGLVTGYVTDVSSLTGQRLRRPVAAGAPLSIEALAPAPLIHRGQQVVVLARTSGIEVRMAGVALSDGRLDDHIRVENSSSHRIVEGVVRSDSVVETPL
jgi:flagella basal body P-ring formation protein FlgA